MKAIYDKTRNTLTEVGDTPYGMIIVASTVTRLRTFLCEGLCKDLWKHNAILRENEDYTLKRIGRENEPDSVPEVSYIASPVRDLHDKIMNSVY